MKEYDHKEIEKKWQKKWASKRIYKTTEDASKPKFYVLDMFPYPSGEGLHVGHPKGYIATDVISRMKRMQRHSVLHPMGFDAFGLPAENYALKTKTNPQLSVAKNVARYKKQLEILGFDYDWSREINTTDPKYYKWTQWIFLKLLEKGLAYESYEPINWCPSCKTGLANEDVEDGKCERCGTQVEKKPMRQWVLKITDYADRLLADLDAVEPYTFTTTTGSDAWREGVAVSERDVVYCIIKHWREDTFLCMKWKKNDWRGYVVGGIEKGENPEEAAIREVCEETGYKNVIVKGILGRTQSRFYQELKKQNRLSHGRIVSLELIDGERSEVSEEERSIQDMEWVPRDKMRDFVNRGDLKYMWDLYTRAAKPKPLLDWPQSIKEAQRNWIGRSEGMIFASLVKGMDLKIKTFSAHFEAFAADTFIVIAPDHPLLKELVKGTPQETSVLQFANVLVNERLTNGYEANKESKGIFTGRYTIDPVGNGELPIWVASYALADYGTGIVKCSCHDERDFAFAKKYGIPLKPVLFPADPEIRRKVQNLEICFTDTKNGVLSLPKEFAGKIAKDNRKEIIEYLEKNNLAEKKTTYRLKDWVFSRQRYWGEPIPVLHDAGKIIPVPEKDLPVVLPKVKHYEPTGTGESPLAGISKWVNFKGVKRETNTMPQWAGSSWYYLRYMDPKNSKALVDPKKEKYWNEVDLYVGGAEHATRHLIYARFWHKFLYDIGVVSTMEPFKKLQSVGLIMGEDGRKMSKRFGNVVNPDTIVDVYGADTLRLYEMFMGPFGQAISWSTDGILGPRRFIERVWRLCERVSESAAMPKDIECELHLTVKKVSSDNETMSFNTAISCMMIFLSKLEKCDEVPREAYKILLKLLAPLAPHMTEELWRRLGEKDSIHAEQWPTFDEAKTHRESVTIVLQVNGKIRATLENKSIASESEIVEIALKNKDILKFIGGKEIKKTIYVKGKLVNFVI